MFWHKSRLECVSLNDGDSNRPERRFFGGKPDNNYCYVVGKFHDLKTQKMFVAVSSHFKASSGYEEMRIKQVEWLIQDLKEQTSSVDFSIVAGDFNEVPNREPVTMMKKEFKSSFETLNNGSEPAFTIFQFRTKKPILDKVVDGVPVYKQMDTGEIKIAIDYVFYQGNI